MRTILTIIVEVEAEPTLEDPIQVAESLMGGFPANAGYEPEVVDASWT